LTSPPSILESNTDQSSSIIGSKHTCIVVRTIGSSLAVRLPSLKQYGIVSSTNLTDESYDDLQQILSSFKAGEKIQCRIIGISLSSNLAICSLKKSIIEAPFITYSDIQIGSLVKGSINHVDKNGLIINLTKHINGFVPIIHNADIPIKEALNKFPLKKKVQCRVLHVDPSRQRLILTMKNSLINTKLPIVCTYNDLQANLLTIGVIISIQEYGLLVKLFGDLCGLVLKNEIGQLQTLSTTNIKSQLQQMFYIGQTVSCKVINFDEEQKKITLSLKVNI
jgi:rRNA biogenesis protein RRP5